MGFTYHYFTQRKIEEIAKYDELLKDPSLDSGTNAMIKDQRTGIITKKRILSKNLDKINGWLYFFSSSWFLILLMALTPKIRNMKAIQPEQRKKAVILFEVIFIIEISIVYSLALWLYSYIQSNFLLYFITTAMQILIFSLSARWIVKAANNAKKKKEEIINNPAK